MAETRKLAAILAADVAGYSKLVGADEERTLAMLLTSGATVRGSVTGSQRSRCNYSRAVRLSRAHRAQHVSTFMKGDWSVSLLSANIRLATTPWSQVNAFGVVPREAMKAEASCWPKSTGAEVKVSRLVPGASRLSNAAPRGQWSLSFPVRAPHRHASLSRCR